MPLAAMPLAAMPRPAFLQEARASASPSPPALVTRRRKRIVIRRTGSSVAKRRLEVEEEGHTMESASKRARVEEVVELMAGLEVEVPAA